MTPAARELLDLALPALRDHAIVLLDVDGVIVGWLGGAERIFGYGADEIVGRHVSALFAPEDVARTLDVHELEVARRDSDSQDDRWHMRKDGTRIWITGTVTAVRDASGLRGYIKLMRDRTDLRINAENRANHLDAADDALGRTHRFLQTLGHELRNPLAPIKNAAYIARRGSADPRVRKAADTILAQVDVLERLTSDLMDVSRLQHRKLDLQLSEFDVRALLEDEAAGQRLPATAKDIRLEAVLPSQPLPLVADASRVRQAVSNLLVNAIKYTPAGGTVWLKATQEAQDIVIRVQDTGIGIAPDVLPRIFELFTQEVRASDLVPGGLGVGLAIVAQIAELHGGVAQARSAGAGKGAEFTLRIPRGGPGAAGPKGVAG
ncbi:PAS domain-containing sensor histidine kinase [Ramlibacter sp. MMS24-I3-19]|uniref:PAS domain-containing sensor histidine kinase n=1 Tax=Ramlibacter sp. MMS24-I3-19 TaxID=3416606 RepID=UPI003CFD0311